MKKIKEEIATVQGELSRTEDSWKKETVRHKEVNRQFQSALVSVAHWCGVNCVYKTYQIFI